MTHGLPEVVGSMALMKINDDVIQNHSNIDVSETDAAGESCTGDCDLDLVLPSMDTGPY